MYMNTDDYIIVPPNGRYVDAEHPKESLFRPRTQGYSAYKPPKTPLLLNSLDQNLSPRRPAHGTGAPNSLTAHSPNTHSN